MSERFVFNGIDASTGEYLIQPVDPHEFAIPSLGGELDDNHRAELSWRVRQSRDATFAPIEGVNAKDLREAGWAIVFPHDQDEAVETALEPLISYRRSQTDDLFRRLTYRPGESKQEFLSRHGAGPGPADPEKVPYYLLLVGSPSEIPFRFQYQLDVQYAIGRICFESPQDYAAYAHAVVRAESSAISRPARATFFGAANPGDQATELSSAELLIPLTEAFATMGSALAVDPVVGDLATKDRLGKILADAPTLLFTATHGVGFPADHPDQRDCQGALVCQDWPGPGSGAISPAWYFSAADIDRDADLTGMIAFHFACFSAGTPEWDDYAHNGAQPRQRLAADAFLSALPAQLLTNPGGPAVAVVGHVDRAWGYSFASPMAGRQTAVFESCFRRLVGGHPIASALEYFNDKYAELSSELTVELEDIRYGKVADPFELAAMWTANNDARAFTLIGDPAVRLAETAPSGVESARRLEVVPPAGDDIEVVAPTVDTLARTLSSELMTMVRHLGEVLVTTSEGALHPSSTPDAGPILRTRLAFDGTATEVHVAPDVDGTAAELLKLHAATVEQAVTARAEFLRALPSLMELLRSVPDPPDEDGEGA